MTGVTTFVYLNMRHVIVKSRRVYVWFHITYTRNLSKFVDPVCCSTTRYDFHERNSLSVSECDVFMTLVARLHTPQRRNHTRETFNPCVWTLPGVYVRFGPKLGHLSHRSWFPVRESIQHVSSFVLTKSGPNWRTGGFRKIGAQFWSLSKLCISLFRKFLVC